MDSFDQSLQEFRLAQQVRDSATAWLQAFEAALASRDAARIGALFHADSHWRDVLAFTWHSDAARGPGGIAARLAAEQPRTGAHGFHLPPGRRAAAPGEAPRHRQHRGDLRVHDRGGPRRRHHPPFAGVRTTAAR